MKIARVQPGEIKAVVKLWKDCGLTRPWNDPHKDINFALAADNSTVLVGLLNEEVVASVMVGHDGHRGALYYLAVSPQHQRQGLGREIHDAGVSWLKQHGVWKINLMVRSENKAVSAFYESLGYAPNNVLSFGKCI